MAIYTASSVSTIVTASANAVLFGFRASTARRCFIREIGFFYRTAPTTSGQLGLQRSTALGTGAITAVVGQAHEPGEPAAIGQVETAWATAAPTTANLYMKRFGSAPTIGNGMVWRFDEGSGLVVPLGSAATGEIVVCNLVATAPGTMDFWFTWEE